MKRLVVLWVFIAVIMMVTVVSARAAVLTYNDYFNIELGPSGQVMAGGGSGYPDGTGEWYVYESGWINQWFYNGPFDPNRWKHIEGWVELDPTDTDYAFDFVINWATPEWDGATGSVAPPLPYEFDSALEDVYIGRELMFSYDSVAGIEPPSTCLEFSFDILEFNPEWISIDVMGYNVVLNGVIMHQCIPEPATMSLLALGGLAVLARRRRS